MDFGAENIVSALAVLFITDPTFCERTLPLKDYLLGAFQDGLRWIAEKSWWYYSKYHSPIGLDFLLEELKKAKRNKTLSGDKVEGIVKLIENVEQLLQNSVMPSADYTLDELIAYAKTQALRNAVIEGAKLLETGKTDDFVAKIQKVVDEFSALNLATGMKLADIDYRTAKRKEGKMPIRVPLGIPDLDALVGGLADGELGVVIAPTGGGKTAFLIHLSVFAMLFGRNVVYITLEMSPVQLLDRIDAFISNVPISKLARNYETVKQAVKRFVNLVKAGIDIKQLPSGLTSVEDIDNYLKVVSSTGFKVGMLVVDYGELLRIRGESTYEGQGENFTKLRGLAVKWNIPVWVASQSNRPAWSKRIIKPDDIAESFKKVHVADIVIGICRTEEEKRKKQVRFYVGKCRFEIDGYEVGPYDSALERGRIVDFGSIFRKPKSTPAPEPEDEEDEPFVGGGNEGEGETE